MIISVRNTRAQEPVYNFEVEGFHTYHIGELGFWVHNTNCFANILEASGKNKPLDLIEKFGSRRVHAHHILFKKGSGKLQQAYVKYGQRILEAHKIDPLKGVENLTWAPNVEGLHTMPTLKPLVKDLRTVYNAGGNRAQIVKVLQKHGEYAEKYGS